MIYPCSSASVNYSLHLPICYSILTACDSYCSENWTDIDLIPLTLFPQIEIVLGKSDKFDELMAAAAEERGEVEDGEEHAW